MVLNTGGSHPGTSNSVGLGGARESAFLMSSHVMWVLLARGPHLENHCSHLRKYPKIPKSSIKQILLEMLPGIATT